MSGTGTGTAVSGLASTGGLVTAPTIEPITLAEAKMHLGLDSETFEGNLTISQSMTYGAHIVKNEYTTHVGTGIDVLGDQAVVVLNSGTNGATGTVDTRIEESDQLATGYTAWTGGAFTQVTTANDNANQQIAYTGTKQYIRTASKVLLATCEFGTSIIVDASETSQDDLLTALIQTAREYVEDITRRALLTQTWDYSIDSWPGGDAIKLPNGNLQSVSSVKYKDSDGDETTMTVTTQYLVEQNAEMCGRVILPYGVSWPSFTAYPSRPITIRYVCGWTTAALIPSKIRTALKMILTDLWENRGDAFVGQIMTENHAAKRLLASSKLWDEF